MLKIKRLTKKYVNEICEIEKRLLEETSIEKIENTIESDVLSYYVLLEDDVVIGFFECKIIPPECELYDICVDTKFQGCGYGNKLLQYLIDLAKKQSCETIFLEVNSINNKAINLYSKFGFEKYFVRKKYYGNNDAILMRKVLI